MEKKTMCNGGSRAAPFVAADEQSPAWGGYLFQSGPVPEGVAGVYVLGRTADGRVFPLYVGEAVDMRTRLTLHEAENQTLMEEADRVYWMRQNSPRLREHIERILLDRYSPPGNSQDVLASAELPPLVTDCHREDRFCVSGRLPEGRLVDGRQLWSIGG